MHRPRIITPECNGWYLIENELHEERPNWHAADRQAFLGLLRQMETFAFAHLDAWLITKRGFRILVRLGPAPKLSDMQVLERIHQLAHPFTTRAAQLALHRDPKGKRWKRFRSFWADGAADVSNVLKWIGTRAVVFFNQHRKNSFPFWKDRSYSHPVEDSPSVRRGVHLYLAAAARRYGWNRANSLASHWDNPGDIRPVEVRELAGRLDQKSRPRKPPGLYGKFSVRLEKRRLRKCVRNGSARMEAVKIYQDNLRRFLDFYAKTGHDRIWESEELGDLRHWRQVLAFRQRRGRLSPQVQSLLASAGIRFPLTRYPSTRDKGAPPTLQPISVFVSPVGESVPVQSHS